MFRMTQTPIKVHDLFDTTLDQVGGIVTFEGRVRNDNHGRRVEKLEYEAFPEMAETEGNKIIQEAMSKFAIEGAYCVHRTGVLVIRDIAIWIVVYAKHREAAYRASEYIIDQVKTRVPIWKKEYYVDGQTDWVKCLACAAKGIPHHDHFHHVK
ncbi:MAG: molybdenum cofactor biosynthesis protein MoaE [Bacteriovoracaceae bacterium]|nr:molybdenum cofactor biosynthesis protein MoaE [Bacteriovoracaceae bacterium]